MNKQNIYLQEIQHQITFALKAYNNYKIELDKSNIPEIFTYIHYFVIHITNIDKLIDCNSNETRKFILLNNLTFNDINLKSFRRLRNHLEHFDERLDKWINEFDGNAYLDMNLVKDCKGFPKKAFLRALDGNIYKFYGEDYNLDELFESLRKIETIVNNKLSL
jgi:hypothetical protein